MSSCEDFCDRVNSESESTEEIVTALACFCALKVIVAEAEETGAILTEARTCVPPLGGSFKLGTGTPQHHCVSQMPLSPLGCIGKEMC